MRQQTISLLYWFLGVFLLAIEVSCTSTPSISPTPKATFVNLLQPTITYFPATEQVEHLVYLWPKILPEGFSIEPSSSEADQFSFLLAILAPTPKGSGFANEVEIAGGLIADKPYQSIQQDHDSTVSIHGYQAMVWSNNGSIWIVWQGDGISYYASGIGVERNTLIQIVENTILLDYDAWINSLAKLTTQTPN